MEPLRKAFTTVREFFHDVMIEFRKVSWPSRREVMGSTTVVLVVVLVLAVFLYGVDQVLSLAVHQFFRLVGHRS